MWLKTLKIKNFQKHSDLTLDFTPGVNIIYGQSDAGKSCIRRAIGFVFFGEPRTDDVIRKEGTKQTSVCAVLDNEVEVERVKSASVNRYIVRVPNQKELVYDSIGAEIPEEVQKVFGMRLIEIDKSSLNLNISEQVTMPFLTGPEFPASARLKLFNKLTGNDLLDITTQGINKDIINRRKDIANEEKLIKNNEPEIEILNRKINDKKKISDLVVDKLNIINKNYHKLEEIKKLRDRIKDNISEQKSVVLELEKVKIVEYIAIASLKEQIKTLGVLSNIKEGLNTCSNAICLVESQVKDLKIAGINSGELKFNIERLNKIQLIYDNFKISQESLETVLKQIQDLKFAPNFDSGNYRAKIDKFIMLSKMNLQFIYCAQSTEKIMKEMYIIDKVIPEQENEFKIVLKEAGVCPTCRTIMTEEHITHVKI